MTIFDHIRAHLLKKVGIVEYQNELNILDLKSTEWSPLFEKLMRNRLVLGAFRYGRLAAFLKPQYNRVESIEKRILLYKKTGNTEFLVDIANLCLCEFVEGKHPNKHFNAIDDGEHVQKLL